jgi:glutamyl-tRNA reductase
MPVSILGINHKTAPISVREKVAFAPHNINDALISLQQHADLDEVAILSTCNRMELIYTIKQHLSNDVVQQQVINWLSDYQGLPSSEIESHCYQHNQQLAISHLMSVASGLDSMVLGEPQILGQVKDAFGYANNAGTIGLYLNRLFQQTFTLAKQVRTDTQIGESAVSVAYAAITLAKRIFADFNKATALFIGAGETVELAAKYLIRQGVINIHIANRTVERAQQLVKELESIKTTSKNGELLNIQAYSLTSLPELIEKADIIISSTASPVPIIGKGLMENAITARKHRTMFLVDLAVPRDIEPEVSSLRDVYLYTVDDMQGVIQDNLKSRESAAIEAKNIVEIHKEKYLSWLQSLSSVNLLKDFRSQFDEIKSEEVARALSKLEMSNEKEQRLVEKIITELSNRLTQKFMHQPSKSIRHAGEENNQETLATIANIFGLNK